MKSIIKPQEPYVIYHGPMHYYWECNIEERHTLDMLASTRKGHMFPSLTAREQRAVLRLHIGRPIRIISTQELQRMMKTVSDYLHTVRRDLPGNHDGQVFPYYSLALELEDASHDLPDDLPEDTINTVDMLLEDISGRMLARTRAGGQRS